MKKGPGLWSLFGLMKAVQTVLPPLAGYIPTYTKVNTNNTHSTHSKNVWVKGVGDRDGDSGSDPEVTAVNSAR
jgi:hypothetical protein